MKRLFIFTALFASILSHSQTLTQAANEPAAGDQDRLYYIDTAAFSNGLPNSVNGNSAVWNFTNLQALSPADTTFYVAPSSVPSSTDYPGCTVVQHGFLDIFIKSTTTPTTQTEILGVRSGTFNLTFTNTAIAAKYPISFGSGSTDNIAGTYTALGFNGPCSGAITTTADGFGTLNLPDGLSYNNVLRVKSVQTVTLTQLSFPIATIVQTIYNYYHNSQKYPLLSVNYQFIATATGSNMNMSYVTGSTGAFVTGLKENLLNQDKISFYPNPANQFYVHLNIPVSLSEKLVVSFYDLTGKKVLSQEIESGSGLDHPILIKYLARGMYTAVCEGTSVRHVQRLVVQ
ncbi:MAG: T9SS type A sorting domain-containing protein [Bacteroidia bacterium]|nr:T9SS type A sorting domain-containing protein [Bacteroidia bacterium]